MAADSFFWHDYETFGTDPRRDRPAQFAGQRTTLDLQPVGEPVNIFCKPADDMLPQPRACIVTGISPQQALAQGISEHEFAATVHDSLALAGTCSAGYNSLRFDDEFSRQLLYRNFFEPYAREWENGNSRWDLIDLARMCYALRPDGIEWPTRTVERGDIECTAQVASFRLEHLAAANQLSATRAHDALSDVHTTIALARLLRTRQPRLFEFYFGLRRKAQVLALLDHVNRTPLLHVSSRYRAESGCLAMIVPLTPHPTLPNGIIVYDLATDPAPLLELDAGDIADRVFSPRDALPEGVERIPLKTVHVNKSPALAPLSTLRGVDVSRIRLDVERCMRHLAQLRDSDGLNEKLRAVFGVTREFPDTDDAELSLYRSLPSDADRTLRQSVRATPSDELATRTFAFRDPRYAELLFRYRARNYPETLDAAEHARWEDFRRVKLTGASELTNISADSYFSELAELRIAHASDTSKTALLDSLEQWGRRITE